MITNINDEQISELAQVGLGTYEMTADWKRARESMVEHAMDEWGVTARASAIWLALKFAKMFWNERAIKVKRDIQ